MVISTALLEGILRKGFVFLSLLLISFVLDPSSTTKDYAEITTGRSYALRSLDPSEHSGNFVVCLLTGSTIYSLIRRSLETSLLQFSLGLALVFFGVVLRLCSFSALGPCFTFELRRLSSRHKLITSGPYKYIRHPGYLGMFLAFNGYILLLVKSGFVQVSAFITLFLMMLSRALDEENFMYKTFPTTYPAYAASRYRFIPYVL